MWNFKTSTFIFQNVPSPPICGCWKKDKNSLLISSAYAVTWWSVAEANKWEFTLKMYILCSTTGRANPSVFAMLYIKEQSWAGAGRSVTACIVQQLTWTLGECVTLLYNGSYACRAEKNKNRDKIKRRKWPVSEWSPKKKLPCATLLSARCFGTTNSPGKNTDIHFIP